MLRKSFAPVVPGGPKETLGSVYAKEVNQSTAQISKARRVARIAGCCSASILVGILVTYVAVIVISSIFITYQMNREYASADWLATNTCNRHNPLNQATQEVLDGPECANAHRVANWHWKTEFLTRLINYQTGPILAFLQLWPVQWITVHLFSDFTGTLIWLSTAIAALRAFYLKVMKPCCEETKRDYEENNAASLIDGLPLTMPNST